MNDEWGCEEVYRIRPFVVVYPCGRIVYFSMMNDERLADVVETQNFASLRVGERYSVPWQVCRVPLIPALADQRFRLAGQRIAFSLGRWLSEARVVFGRGG